MNSVMRLFRKIKITQSYTSIK